MACQINLEEKNREIHPEKALVIIPADTRDILKWERWMSSCPSVIIPKKF